nr:hypothetical protein MACL_00001214 [Theileria orientalis]
MPADTRSWESLFKKSEEDKKKALDKIIAILDEAINESALAFPPSESKDKDSSEVIKLYKENDTIEMTNNDFLQDDFMGNYTYAFKPGVECILVMFDDKNVWRRGDGKVDLPKSVTYDTVLSEVAVRDAEKTAFFKKDEETGEWKHVVTMSRERKPKVLHRSS